MAAQREVTVDDLGEVVIAKFPQGLGQVVHHEAIVVGEKLDSHLGYFPAGDVEVQSVEKGHVLTNHVRHWHEQVRGTDHHFDRLVGVAEHGDGSHSRKSVLSTGKHA